MTTAIRNSFNLTLYYQEGGTDGLHREYKVQTPIEETNRLGEKISLAPQLMFYRRRFNPTEEDRIDKGPPL